MFNVFPFLLYFLWLRFLKPIPYRVVDFHLPISRLLFRYHVSLLRFSHQSRPSSLWPLSLVNPFLKGLSWFLFKEPFLLYPFLGHFPLYTRWFSFFWEFCLFCSSFLYFYKSIGPWLLYASIGPMTWFLELTFPL